MLGLTFLWQEQSPLQMRLCFPAHPRLLCSLLPHTQEALLTGLNALPCSIPVCSLLSSPAQFLSHSGKLCEAKKVLSTPFSLPRLHAPGVVKLELGARCATGVDGTELVACTAMSVLSAATELGMGVLGFSCFCCTANSCRKSA